MHSGSVLFRFAKETQCSDSPRLFCKFCNKKPNCKKVISHEELRKQASGMMFKDNPAARMTRAKLSPKERIEQNGVCSTNFPILQTRKVRTTMRQRKVSSVVVLSNINIYLNFCPFFFFFFATFLLCCCHFFIFFSLTLYFISFLYLTFI